MPFNLSDDGRTLANPLDRFQSYSTHFVMVACRTTETARLFANNHAADETERASVSNEVMRAIDNTKALGEAIEFRGNDRDMYLVIDTRRFSQFTIETLKYDVLINGLVKGNSHANLATEVEMTIQDSVGISFMNFMQWLMDEKMQTNFEGMIFMLKVIFVGHNPPTTAGVVTDTIASFTLPMHLNRMDVNLDYSKGEYHCTFLPNINFATNYNKHWLNIGSAKTYFTGEGNTLGGVIDSFMGRLNDESVRFYKEISDAMAKNERIKPGERYGRLVKYVITIPEEWRAYKVTGRGVHEALERNFQEEKKRKEEADKKKQEEAKKKQKDAGADDNKESTDTHAKNTYVTVENGMTIPQVLDLILSQVDEVKKYANSSSLGTADDEKLRFYKYVIGVTSDSESFEVQVHIVPFEVPKLAPPAAKKFDVSKDDKFYNDDTDPATGVKRRIPKNFFELDYIFTGKNKDILNFELKIENLNFLLASNVKVSEGQLFNVVVEGQRDGVTADNKALKNKDIIFARQYDPVFIPMLTEEERKGFSNYITPRKDKNRYTENSQQFTKNLSAFYANSPISMHLTIRGNPYIMEKFIDQKPMPMMGMTTASDNGSSSPSAEAISSARKRFEAEMLKVNSETITRGSGGNFSTKQRPLGDDAYYASPVFAKINIKGPNVDFRTNELIADQDFATEVLQDNYYVVFKVTNIIDRGVFTQELEMWSHNVFGLNKLTDEDKKKGRL